MALLVGDSIFIMIVISMDVDCMCMHMCVLVSIWVGATRTKILLYTGNPLHMCTLQ